MVTILAGIIAGLLALLGYVLTRLLDIAQRNDANEKRMFELFAAHTPIAISHADSQKRFTSANILNMEAVPLLWCWGDDETVKKLNRLMEVFRSESDKENKLQSITQYQEFMLLLRKKHSEKTFWSKLMHVICPVKSELQTSDVDLMSFTDSDPQVIR